MTVGAQNGGVFPDGCPACGALPIDWAGGANPHAFCATPAPAGWLPIEGAPRDGEVLLFVEETGEQFVAFFGTDPEDGDKQWVFARGNGISFIVRGPTHWMPLPTAPAEGGV